MADLFIRIPLDIVQGLLCRVSPNACQVFIAILGHIEWEPRSEWECGQWVQLAAGEFIASVNELEHYVRRERKAVMRAVDELIATGEMAKRQAVRHAQSRTVYSVREPQRFVPVRSAASASSGPKTGPLDNSSGPKTGPASDGNSRQPVPKRDRLYARASTAETETETEFLPPAPSAGFGPEGKKEDQDSRSAELQERRAAGAAELQAFRESGPGDAEAVERDMEPTPGEMDFLRGLIEEAYGKNGRAGR